MFAEEKNEGLNQFSGELKNSQSESCLLSEIPTDSRVVETENTL